VIGDGVVAVSSHRVAHDIAEEARLISFFLFVLIYYAKRTDKKETTNPRLAFRKWNLSRFMCITSKFHAEIPKLLKNRKFLILHVAAAEILEIQ